MVTVSAIASRRSDHKQFSSYINPVRGKLIVTRNVVQKLLLLVANLIVNKQLSNIVAQYIINMAPLNANDLQRIFEKLDRNGDGLVSLEELKWVLERIRVHFSLEELETLVEKPSLNFNEFLFFCDSIQNVNRNEKCSDDDQEDHQESKEADDEESDLYKAFNVFDLNGDGFITSEELQSVLARLGLWDEKSGEDCRSMIYVYDTNSDGVLDFEEFKNMMFRTTIS